MKTVKHLPRTIRFRKWSRKAYAAFASIGKCVTIGHVSKSIADNSLTKSKTVTSPVENAGKGGFHTSPKTVLQEEEEGERVSLETVLKTVLPVIVLGSYTATGHSHEHLSNRHTYRHILPDTYNIGKYMPALFKKHCEYEYTRIKRKSIKR